MDNKGTDSKSLLDETLKSIFGYDSFRPEQEQIIKTFLLNKDCLAILPTGGGKSLCFQLPAIMREGLTLVVSPLIALMKDQVDQLTAIGIEATYLNSSVTKEEIQNRLIGLGNGKYKLLYVAPERLFSEGFIENLKKWNVSSFAIDEAHCISAWGHQFRPEYRKLSELREHFSGIPFIALTATATRRVKMDIIEQLKLKNPHTFLASFNRPNLHYSVVPKQKVAEQLCKYVKKNQDVSGIIYCQAQKTTEQYALKLQAEGIAAAPYHAGLSKEERAKNQESFIRDDVSVICATIAFGMGIDKPNVRYIIHADLPKNIESYYQETGRAGRDGLDAECVLLYSRNDYGKLIYFINELENEQEARVAKQQLGQMINFAENTACRRATLLNYFGENLQTDNCSNCDNCQEKRDKEDVTDEATKLIYCVDMIAKNGYPMGLKHAVDVLRGSRSAKLIQKKHDKLRAYGKGLNLPASYWLALGRQLLHEGYFQMTDSGYSTLTITKKAINAVNTKQPILIRLPTLDLGTKRKNLQNDSYLGQYDVTLFQDLRLKRKSLAQDQKVPPYVICDDTTLKAMAENLPSTKEEFLALPGIGKRRLDQYGTIFMEVIAKHTKVKKEVQKENESFKSKDSTTLDREAFDETSHGEENNEDIKKIRELALKIGNTGENRDKLIRFFNHHDYEVRRRACSAANKLKDKSIVSKIGSCISASEPQIRQYALKAILSSKCKSLNIQVKAQEKLEEKEYNKVLIEKILKL